MGLDMSARGTLMEIASKLSELQRPCKDLKLRASAAVQWCIAEYNTVQLSEEEEKTVLWRLVLTC